MIVYLFCLYNSIAHPTYPTSTCNQERNIRKWDDPLPCSQQRLLPRHGDPNFHNLRHNQPQQLFVIPKHQAIASMVQKFTARATCGASATLVGLARLQNVSGLSRTWVRAERAASPSQATTVDFASRFPFISSFCKPLNKGLVAL